ncbi:glycine--tRNA ligase subunit beta [Dongia sp.]|uniref:glycine--tRNA ligase subunit beta n=1 Tax=Dongia sp. TaxID=1977262 RepID=UPI0035AF59D2
MAELLLELFSEEIPARMQARAAEDLQRLVTDKLKTAGLAFTSAKSFVTPRRLALVVDGLPLAQPDVKEEKKGPRVGSPQQAVDGFLKSAGLASLDQCEKRDTGKGEFYFAVVEKKGVATSAILPEIILAAMNDLPWPKSMRWAANTQRWVRPLHSIVALLDGQALSGAFELGGDKVAFGNKTKGHRFLSSGEITVTNFADYQAKLKAAKVILDQAERRAEIKRQAEAAAAKEGLTVKQDEGLLDEVTGLVEWPTVLVGKIDDEFMSVPHEVLTTSMRVNQKYFALLDKNGKLAPRFLVTANIEANDGGAAIVHGNERVLRARLSDAKFFWDQDLKVSLAERTPQLDTITYHAKLGSVGQKVSRVKALSRELAKFIPGCDAGLANQAAGLAKADLVSGMVGEFPELQGIMGRYYARHENLPDAVADAIADHYKPLGPGDTCPSAPVSIAVALADKIDTLTGFFAIDEKPTGSKDPFALRRAALGIIRLILENKLRFSLRAVLDTSLLNYVRDIDTDKYRGFDPLGQIPAKGKIETRLDNKRILAERDVTLSDLLEFFADRLRVVLKESGVRHDLINAVFASGESDLTRLLARVEALKGLLTQKEGVDLLAAFKRANNILRIEEKKDGKRHEGKVDPRTFVLAEEEALNTELEFAIRGAKEKLELEQFGLAMGYLSRIRDKIDAFFEKVIVNDADVSRRLNRLQLLNKFTSTLSSVADFSKIEG